VTNNPNNQKGKIVKAGALMCPTCCVEYNEIEVDFEYEGMILKNVKVLRCPGCEEELFTPEQQFMITERIHNHR
jgi:YgiT-type zinc finger domain-containing protein